MDLYIFLVFVLLSNINGSKGHFLNRNSIKNKEDLIDIIKALNDETKEKIDKNNIEMKDNSDELSDSEKERRLQEILQLLKKNYNGKQHYNELIKNPIHSGARLYFIRNPDVLNEYKHYLTAKKILPLISEEVMNQEKEAGHKQSHESKRRAEFRTASTELSEANEFDKIESHEDNEQNNERSNEATLTLSDYSQDRHTFKAEERVRKPQSKVNLKEVIKDIQYKPHDETKEESYEAHKPIANDDFDDNIVRREKIEWNDSNNSVDKDTSKKNDKIEKSIEFTTKKNKYVDDRREKRVYDEPTTEREFQYVPKFKPDYRKPKNEGKKDYMSYGRTSKPFVGKKGIYEDN